MDKVIHNGTVVVMDDAFTILTSGAVAIQDGIIRKVWSPGPGERLPEADAVVDAGGGLIMPGLINAHIHLPMSLFRGMADDLSLDQWLNGHIFPAEAAHISPPNVGIGARLSLAEMLLSGTTTCCDGYFLESFVAPAAKESGIRAVLGQGVIDFPAPGVADPDQNIAHAAAFVKDWQAQTSNIQPSIFCHSPYTCSDSTLRKAKATATELGVLFQIHVAETAVEADQCRQKNGCSPVQHLHRLGILDEHSLLIHAIWADAEDIEVIAHTGAGVVHCPESNMKLASGIAPVPVFIRAGISCGLGTDGCASNNDLSLFGEMRTAALLHKVAQMDPTALDAASTLKMATTEGARALGMADTIGSLEVGKQADIILVDVDTPHMVPLYHPASHLVYAASGSDVRHVFIGGRWVVRNGILQTMDLDSILSEARALGQIIAGPS
jgi:5-methylthioadenosine/S-adenosylhomocysteine deaminase